MEVEIPRNRARAAGQMPWASAYGPAALRECKLGAEETLLPMLSRLREDRPPLSISSAGPVP